MENILDSDGRFGLCLCDIFTFFNINLLIFNMI